MKKYIRIELVDNQTSLQAVVEDQRLGLINCKNVLEVVANSDLVTDISISQDMVDNFIKDYEVFTKKDKITIVIATLVNGFTIVESSACVDPKNYNESMGADICKQRINDKVWAYLGFLLQCGVGGIK